MKARRYGGLGRETKKKQSLAYGSEFRKDDGSFAVMESFHIVVEIISQMNTSILKKDLVIGETIVVNTKAMPQWHLRIYLAKCGIYQLRRLSLMN